MFRIHLKCAHVTDNKVTFSVDKYYNFRYMTWIKRNYFYEIYNGYLCILSYYHYAIFISRLHEGKRFMHSAPNTAAILYRLQCIDRLRQLPTLYVVSEWQAGRWNRNFLFPRHHLPSRSNPLQCFGLPANPSSPPMPIYMDR